jgi:hypothetical protein
VNYLAPAKAFADSVASLDSRRLARMGLFERSPNALTVECQVVSAESPAMQVEVRWDQAAGEVVISTPGRRDVEAQSVAVHRVVRPRGGGFYFRCPIDGTSCEKLYHRDGRWGGRKGLQLKYTAQMGSMHDRYSRRALRLASLLEGGAKGGPLTGEARAELEARLADIERRLAAQPRRNGASTALAAETLDYSDLRFVTDEIERPVALGRLLACDKAVERARTLATDDDDSLGWLFRRGDLLKRVVSLRPPQAAVNIARRLPDFLENHPRVSLRTLAELSVPKLGARRGVQLDWSGLGCEIDSCNLMIDLRDASLGFAGFEICSEGQWFDQAIRIVGDTEDELKFVCPLSGLETETVAFRGGCFAAPAALRLTRRHGRV